MKKKIILLICIGSLFILGILFIILKKDNYKFILDSQNKYEVITNMRYITMLNDGGSHTNIYYQIDLDKNIIIKIKEDYKANIGGTPETKKENVYKKKTSRKLKEELQNTLDKAINNEDIRNDNYSFYVINTKDIKKEIYNTDTIKEIENILNKIDEEKR